MVHLQFAGARGSHAAPLPHVDGQHGDGATQPQRSTLPPQVDRQSCEASRLLIAAALMQSTRAAMCFGDCLWPRPLGPRGPRMAAHTRLRYTGSAQRFAAAAPRLARCSAEKGRRLHICADRVLHFTFPGS
jgi:hypothetical protein